MDIVDILKATNSSSFDFRSLNIVGTFAMVDKLGNSSEDDVLRVTYLRTTVDRINWTGFLTDNVYEVAESVWLHPAFR